MKEVTKYADYLENFEDVALFERYLNKLTKFELGMLLFALMKDIEITNKKSYCRDVWKETRRLRKEFKEDIKNGSS